jgi:hypothetical protein
MTEIIDRPATDEIGEERDVRKLERGDHVRLRDGRWALLLSKPAVGLAVAGSNRYGASVCIEQKHTEGASWEPGTKVFSRTPAEQMRYVESVFTSLKVDATAASILRGAR